MKYARVEKENGYLYIYTFDGQWDDAIKLERWASLISGGTGVSCIQA
jgi:hypothetical protein